METVEARRADLGTYQDYGRDGGIAGAKSARYDFGNAGGGISVGPPDDNRRTSGSVQPDLEPLAITEDGGRRDRSR